MVVQSYEEQQYMVLGQPHILQEYSNKFEKEIIVLFILNPLYVLHEHSEIYVGELCSICFMLCFKKKNTHSVIRKRFDCNSRVNIQSKNRIFR